MVTPAFEIDKVGLLCKRFTSSAIRPLSFRKQDAMDDSSLHTKISRTHTRRHIFAVCTRVYTYVLDSEFGIYIFTYAFMLYTKLNKYFTLSH